MKPDCDKCLEDCKWSVPVQHCWKFKVWCLECRAVPVEMKHCQTCKGRGYVTRDQMEAE